MDEEYVKAVEAVIQKIELREDFTDIVFKMAEETFYWSSATNSVQYSIRSGAKLMARHLLESITDEDAIKIVTHLQRKLDLSTGES